jgi:hypothetical protein
MTKSPDLPAESDSTNAETVAIEIIEQITTEVFSSDVPVGQEVTFLRQKMKTLDAETLGESLPLVQSALETLRHFFAGADLLRSAEDYSSAKAHFSNAAEGFTNIGYDELVLQARVNLAVASGLESLQVADIPDAKRHFDAAEILLKDASDLNEDAASQLEHLQLDALFIEAMRRLTVGDLPGAELIVEKASTASRRVAERYYAEDSPLYRAFMGQSYFVLSYYDVIYYFNELAKLNYDAIVAQGDIAGDAIRARQFTEDLDMEVFARMAVMANVFEEMLGVLQTMAKLMLNILKSNLSVESASFSSMRQGIKDARDQAGRFGEQGVYVLRLCDHMTTMINNLERLLRPTTKDFGRFAGLAACVVFAVLFLVLSAAGFFFDIDLNATQLIIACIVLAIIGGFGYGALRFQGLLGLVSPGGSVLGRGSDGSTP